MTFFRVATYNVHGCVGRAGRPDPARIGEVLGGLSCDIVGLQEIDVGRRRSARVDQVAELARERGYEPVFGAAFSDDDAGAYGNAVLSRWPVRSVATVSLPSARGLRCEPRCLVEARIATPVGELVVLSTHLGVRMHERVEQGAALLERIRTHLARSSPVVLLADLNVLASSRLVSDLRRVLHDVRFSEPNTRMATYPARMPLLSLDHVFVSAPLKVISSGAYREAPSMIASDHLPLRATIHWPAEPSLDFTSPSGGTAAAR